MWIFWLIAAPFVVYGVHRFLLRLEERGYVYYWNKQPKPGGGSSFLPLQEFIQPEMHHVIEAEEHVAEKIGDDRPKADPPEPAA
jgi:hypothetical protein